MTGLRYSRWDGSQEPFEIQADEVMDEISNDLFADNSVMRALQRLMQRGMNNRSGQRTQGIKEMLEHLKKRREQYLQQYDLSSTMKDVEDRLKDIVDTERKGIDDRLDEARKQAESDTSQRDLLDMMQSLANKRLESLDNLPESPAGQIKELGEYDFMDPEARRKYEELMDELKKQAMQQYFQDMQQSMQSMTPEQMAGMRQMLQDLNQMMQQHMQGNLSQEQFDRFMQQYGPAFGDNPPSDMDELIDQLQDRMAQADN